MVRSWHALEATLAEVQNNLTALERDIERQQRQEKHEERCIDQLLIRLAEKECEIEEDQKRGQQNHALLRRVEPPQGEYEISRELPLRSYLTHHRIMVVLEGIASIEKLGGVAAVLGALIIDRLLFEIIS